MPPKAKRWCPNDTTPLADLVELEGVIDIDNPAHLTLPFIEKVRLNHLRHFTAKNFCNNYQKVLRDYCLGVEHEGAKHNNREGMKIY